MLTDRDVGECYRCHRFVGPFRSFVLYLDPRVDVFVPRVVVCEECLADDDSVVRVSPFAFRVAPPRDLTQE